MARPDHSDKVPKIKADFKTGDFSVRKLADKYKVSVGFVAKHVKGMDKEFEEVVNAGVAYKSSLANLDEHSVNAVNDVVNERTKHLIYFQNSALRGQELANNVLHSVTNQYQNASEQEKEELTVKAIMTAKEHSVITQRNKESVLGKDQEVQKPVNNFVIQTDARRD